MAVTVQLNGVTYDIPEPGDSGWGQDLSDYFVAQASGLLQKAGGAFTLTAEVDFGNTFGLKSAYFKTRTALPAAAGVLRLARTDSVSWRNAANSADLPLGVDVSGNLTFDGNTFVSGGITDLTGDVTASGPGSAVATIGANKVTDAKFRQSAALTVVGRSANSTGNVADISAGTDNFVLRRSGTTLGFGLLVNANIDAAAAIAFSKLASLTSANILVGSAGNVATAVAMSGDATISNVGVITLSTGKAFSSEILNLGLSASVGSSALTVALKQADGTTDPSTGSAAVSIGFRSSTASSGAYTVRTATSPLSVVVSSGSTLGQGSGFTHFIWVYALDNAGTIELGVSSTRFDDASVQSTTAEGGAGAADSGGVIYSTTARSNVPIRVIGRLTVTEATAGTWATAPSEISLTPMDWVIGTDYVTLHNDNGNGSSTTTVRKYVSVSSTRSRSMFYTQSATLGDSITIVASGVYSVAASVRYTSGANQNVSVEANTTTVSSRVPYPAGTAVLSVDAITGGILVADSRALSLAAGDVIRMCTPASLTSSDSAPQYLSVVRVD